MIKAQDAIRAARSLIGTPYSELDCINLIKRVIRTAPGGVPWYTTAGTNALWASYIASDKYRDIIWRQEGITGARAGMLAFKKHGGDVHHVGLVTVDGTLNLRSGAGADKHLIETMPNGTIVRCYGYHTGDWLYVVSAAGNKGYCHGGYLERV